MYTRILFIIYTIFLVETNAAPTTQQPQTTTVGGEFVDPIIDGRSIDEGHLCNAMRMILFSGEQTYHDAAAIFDHAASLIRGRSERRTPQRASEKELDRKATKLIRFATGNNSFNSELGQNLPSTNNTQLDPNFCQPSTSSGRTRTTSLAVKKRILELIDSGRSEKGIQAQYPWFRREYLKSFRDDVGKGGSQTDKKKDINEHVANQARVARERYLPLRGYMLRDWAMQRAREIGMNEFRASKGWLHNFQNKYNIVSRKITKNIPRSERNQESAIAASEERFHHDYDALRQNFYQRLIWNFDQTGFNYEPSTSRTLSYEGERDTYVDADSKNKQTHSYTTIPMISRAGKTIGKLAICLKEKDGKFGRRVRQEVDEQLESLGNLYVVASESGKMTSNLMLEWKSTVLAEAAVKNPDYLNSDENERHGGVPGEGSECFESEREQALAGGCGQLFPAMLFSKEISSDCGRFADYRARRRCNRRPHVLLIGDSWGGQTGDNFNRDMRSMGVKYLQIPKLTTSRLQPLDVGFNRQYKIFSNRLHQEAFYQNLIGELTTRAGILNLQSLMWNQFGSPAYRDMIRYAWHSTDPTFNREELANHSPAGVRDVQFGFDKSKTCEIENCRHKANIRCSHCGKLLCLRHFLERWCFHAETASDQNDLPYELGRMDVDEDYMDEDEDDDDMELDFVDSFFGYSSTTSSTVSPIHVELA